MSRPKHKMGDPPPQRTPLAMVEYVASDGQAWMLITAYRWCDYPRHIDIKEQGRIIRLLPTVDVESLCTKEKEKFNAVE